MQENRAIGLRLPAPLIEAVPYKIHTVLTDNGIQFTFPPRYADGPTARYMTHMFDMRCRENGIEHRLTKIKHPWTNGQVERMNRTIKEATVKRYHYDSHEQLEAHLADFIRRLQFRPTPEDPQGSHTLRIHLQNLDKRAQTIHPQSDPSNAGTKHLNLGSYSVICCFGNSAVSRHGRARRGHPPRPAAMIWIAKASCLVSEVCPEGACLWVAGSIPGSSPGTTMTLHDLFSLLGPKPAV